VEALEKMEVWIEAERTLRTNPHYMAYFEALVVEIYRASPKEVLARVPRLSG
jgi:hypothetical protein